MVEWSPHTLLTTDLPLPVLSTPMGSCRKDRTLLKQICVAEVGRRSVL